MVCDIKRAHNWNIRLIVMTFGKRFDGFVWYKSKLFNE